jgi:hypothetical protein
MIIKYIPFKNSNIHGCMRGARIEKGRSQQYEKPYFFWSLFFNGGGIEQGETKFTSEYACQVVLDKRIELELAITSRLEKELKETGQTSLDLSPSSILQPPKHN